MEGKGVCYEAVGSVVDLMLARPRRKREDVESILAACGYDVDEAIEFLTKKRIINLRGCLSDAGKQTVELGFRPNTYFIIFDMLGDNWRCTISAARHKPRELVFHRYSHDMTFSENYFTFISDVLYALNPYQLCRVLALTVLLPYGDRVPRRVTLQNDPNLCRSEVSAKALLSRISESMKKYPIIPTYLHTVCAEETKGSAYFYVNEERCISFADLPDGEYSALEDRIKEASERFFCLVTDAESTVSYRESILSLVRELCGIYPFKRICVDLDHPIKGAIPKIERAVSARLCEEGLDWTEVCVSPRSEAPLYKMATRKALHLYLKKTSGETSSKKKLKLAKM